MKKKPDQRVAAAPRSGTDCVLVVDDDPTARDLMRRFLSREGFDVVTAKGGAEGLALAREIKPAVITLDVLMRDVDGWQVLQSLKADPDLAAIPVVMLTILDEKNRGFALGAAGYLNKPIDRNKLISLLQQLKSSSAAARALVVEDDTATRELIQRLLTGEGWAVRIAGNGREALERIEAEQPDIILLDLMMPEMDGFEFLSELRKRPGLGDIPVIIVTAADLSAEDRARLNGGVKHILQKNNFGQEELLREIASMVGRYAPGASPAVESA